MGRWSVPERHELTLVAPFGEERQREGLDDSGVHKSEVPGPLGVVSAAAFRFGVGQFICAAAQVALEAARDG